MKKSKFNYLTIRRSISLCVAQLKTGTFRLFKGQAVRSRGSEQGIRVVPSSQMVGQTYTMIVKFRLQRDGSIEDVAVQQSSGNTSFDMAGQHGEPSM